MNGFLASRIRTWLSCLHSRCPEGRIDVNRQVFPWLVRHVAWLPARCHARHDGLTPRRVIKGFDYSTSTVLFAETCIATYPDLKGRSKSKPRWFKRIWVGRLEADNSAIMLAEAGASAVRTFRLFTEARKNDFEALEDARGLPWAPQQGARVRKAARLKSLPAPSLEKTPSQEGVNEAERGMSDQRKEELHFAPSIPQANAEAQEAENSDSESSAGYTPTSSRGIAREEMPAEAEGAREEAESEEFQPGTETRRAAARPAASSATPSTPFGINAVPLPRPQPEKRTDVPPPDSARVRIEAGGDHWAPEDCKAITDQLAELNVHDPFWGKKHGEVCSVLEYYEQQGLQNNEDVYNARLKEIEKLGERKTFTPMLKKQVSKDSKVFHSTWMEKMSDGEAKSRLTTADVKSACSKEPQRTSELTFSRTSADESHQLFEIGALQNDDPT